MTSQPQLYEKFIAYVDILGFESTVESLEKPEGVNLSDLLDYCSKLAQESHIKNVASYGPIICPESRYNSRDLDYEVTQFSDCVVVSTEVSPAGIINLLQHVSACVFGLMTKGVMVRGYITKGKIYHRGGQPIGPGYQRAWRMEREVKAFLFPLDNTSTPFVEIDKHVVNYVGEETDQCVRGIYKRLTKQDENGIAVIFPFHRLSAVAGQNIENAAACRKSLRIIRNSIANYLEKLDANSPCTDSKANEKAKYYRRILNEQLSECDRIEKSLHTMKEPAIRGGFDENLNVVCDC